jgi:hypothetical protein
MSERHFRRRMALVYATASSYFAHGCGVVVRPDVADVAAVESSADTASPVDVRDEQPDVVEQDAASDAMLPITSRIVVTNRAPTSAERDMIEAAYVPWATPTNGYWTEASGRCEVETLLHPAFSQFAARIELSIDSRRVIPVFGARDARWVWRADGDELVPGSNVAITAENPMWPTLWRTSVTVPPYPQLSNPPAGEYRVAPSDPIRVIWTTPDLSPSAVVELRIVNFIYNESLRLTDLSAIRCEYPPRLGEATIRIGDHRAFRYAGTPADNVVLTLNVIERKYVPSEGGTVDVLARSEGVFIPVIVRN